MCIVHSPGVIKEVRETKPSITVGQPMSKINKEITMFILYHRNTTIQSYESGITTQ